MQTILYQGRPDQEARWEALPANFADSYKWLDYQVRTLVVLDEVQQAMASLVSLITNAQALLAERADEAGTISALCDLLDGARAREVLNAVHEDVPVADMAVVA